MRNFTALLIAAALLAACGKSEPEAPSADQLRAEALANSDKNAKLQALLEQQRSTAMDNIKFNAAAYFASNPRFQPASEWNIVPHTDDYISPSCPQGSGWGWANVMKVDKKDVVKVRLYCSTSSASLGCYKDDDFKSGPHAAQAAKCDANLPHPLKPIAR